MTDSSRIASPCAEAAPPRVRFARIEGMPCLIVEDERPCGGWRAVFPNEAAYPALAAVAREKAR